jgi:hypothetical protein
MATYYKQEVGHFHFHDDLVKMVNDQPLFGPTGEPLREEALVHSSVEVAIAYCELPDRIHVFTHGTAEGMVKWVETHNSHSPYKAKLKVFGQDTSVETINKAIVDPQFFSTLL